MFRNLASKTGLIGFALLGGAGLAAACSSSGGTSNGTTTGGSSSGGTSSMAHAGTASSSGGSVTSGAGTSSIAGTSSSTAGTSAGGAGGASGVGPFTCAGTKADCNTWTTFPQSTTQSWGNGMFTGGITVFGTGATRDAATTDSIHVTGMVTGYGFGFGLYFTTCSDISQYTGVSFKVKGTTGTTGMLQLQVQTNADYPWQPRPTDMKGGCTSTDPMIATMPTLAYNTCIAPNKSVPVTTTESTVMVAFTDLAGGMPTATADPKQVIGIQWALPWTAAATAYAADVTVSDLTLVGGTGVSCAMGAGGTGGAGAGGASGGSGGAAAGAGGASGGTGGAGGSGGAGGKGGTGGTGGASGKGGTGGA